MFGHFLLILPTTMNSFGSSERRSILSDDWIDIKKDPKHVARERAKAKELRKSDWWKQELAKGKCHYCGKQFAPEDLTMDHILPVVRGGKSVKSNCVPCCKECNNEKKYLTPAEIIMRELDNEKKPSDD
jgi:5-methylcytosine-specific restriction endonuclease McrA